MKNKEVFIVTKLLANVVAGENKKYKDYFAINNEMDYLLSPICWDDFIEDVLKTGSNDYLYALTITLLDNLKVLRTLNRSGATFFDLWSFTFEKDDFWHIGYSPSKKVQMMRTKINLKDIIMAIMMADKDMKLYEILHKEILLTPIYNS